MGITPGTYLEFEIKYFYENRNCCEDRRGPAEAMQGPFEPALKRGYDMITTNL